MSGEKRTPIEIARDDIRDLRRQVSTMRSNHAESLRRARRQNEEEINRLRRRTEERENAMNQRVGQMSTDMRQMRVHHDAEIKKQAGEFYAAQQRQSQEFMQVQRATYNQLSQSIQETNQYVESIRRSHEQQLGQIRNQVNSILARQQQTQQQAAQLLNDLQCEVAIVQAMPYKKFRPQQINQILSRIQGLNNLPPESQMGIAHTAIRDLIVLEEEIETERFRYEAIHLQVLHSIDTLLSDIHANKRSLRLSDEDPEVLDVDFWTDNGYSELESSLINIRANLVDNYANPEFDTDTLIEVAQMVEEMEQRQEALIYEAVEKANSSAMRAAIAEKIAEVLHDSHCYEVVDYGYEKQDLRKSYLAKLRNPDNGSEVVVLIYPESTTSQQLILKTKTNGYISEIDLYTRAVEINRELKAAGIQVNADPREVSPGNEHSLDGLYDIAAILRENGEGIPQQVLQNVQQTPTTHQHLWKE